ncbi:hypothetical protein [Planktotalea sp.]|uniref:hypothetical protein n=1 Tax=Planktotalea sp. TaxID=2029877 RepID=UPI003D6B4F06
MRDFVGLIFDVDWRCHGIIAAIYRRNWRPTFQGLRVSLADRLAEGLVPSNEARRLAEYFICSAYRAAVSGIAFTYFQVSLLQPTANVS